MNAKWETLWCLISCYAPQIFKHLVHQRLSMFESFPVVKPQLDRSIIAREKVKGNPHPSWVKDHTVEQTTQPPTVDRDVVSDDPKFSIISPDDPLEKLTDRTGFQNNVPNLVLSLSIDHARVIVCWMLFFSFFHMYHLISNIEISFRTIRCRIILINLFIFEFIRLHFHVSDNLVSFYVTITKSFKSLIE